MKRIITTRYVLALLAFTSGTYRAWQAEGTVLCAAAGCTVLELGPATVSITGPAGGILGDICIAPKGSLAMSGDEYVTGTIRLGVGAHFQNSSHGTVNVQQNADLSAQINAAYAEY